MKITEISVCMDREDGGSHIVFWRGTKIVRFYTIINYNRVSYLLFNLNYHKDFKASGYYDDEGRRMYVDYTRIEK